MRIGKGILRIGHGIRRVKITKTVIPGTLGIEGKIVRVGRVVLNLVRRIVLRLVASQNGERHRDQE
jgi:hypothetical protein